MSEASYVYILSGQKSIKNAKSSPFWRVFEHNVLEWLRKVSFNTVSEASYVYILSGQKFSKNAKNGSIDHGEFSKNSNCVTRQIILDWTKK